MDADDELMEVKKIKNAFFHNIELENNENLFDASNNENRKEDEEQANQFEIDDDIFEKPTPVSKVEEDSIKKREEEEEEKTPAQNMNKMKLGFETTKNSNKRANANNDFFKTIKDGRRMSANVINRKMFYDNLKVENNKKSKEAESINFGFAIQLNPIGEDDSSDN